MKFDAAELETIKIRYFCNHCGTEKDGNQFSTTNKNQCDSCRKKATALSKQGASDRRLQELLVKYSGIAGDDKLTAPSLNAITVALSEEIGGPKAFAKEFRNFMLTALERYSSKVGTDAEGNAVMQGGQGARTVLDIFKTYIKLVKDNEGNRRDIEDLGNTSDEDLRRMLATSLLQDMPAEDGDELLRALAEARGKVVIEAVESESVNAGECVTAN